MCFEDIDAKNNQQVDMKIEYDKLADKHENMRQANQAKAQKQMAVQELYDKLKRSSGRAQVESAAVDAVDDTILAASRGNAVGDTRNFVSQNSRTNGYTENLNQNMTHLQSRSRATYQSVNGGWNAVDGSRGHSKYMWLSAYRHLSDTVQTYRLRLHQVSGKEYRIDQ